MLLAPVAVSFTFGQAVQSMLQNLNLHLMFSIASKIIKYILSGCNCNTHCFDQCSTDDATNIFKFKTWVLVLDNAPEHEVPSLP